jgi:DedD protein
MATESPNDLELALKKRARRRLVGAIALVLFMVIVLPMVLQDRAALAPQEAIKITMPDDVVNQQASKVEANVTPVEPQLEVATASESATSEPIKLESPAVTEIDKPVQSESAKEVKDEKKAEDKKPVKKAEVTSTDTKKTDVKSSETKATEAKKPEVKEPEVKTATTNGESFTIQVGVFSDLANVKQLQVRLKQVGLDSRTENITTPKGEKIRLRAGRFNSRQEAAYALTKLQAADLTGMVISNN